MTGRHLSRQVHMEGPAHRIEVAVIADDPLDDTNAHAAGYALVLDDEVKRLRRLRVNFGDGALGADGQVQDVVVPFLVEGRTLSARRVSEIRIDELRIEDAGGRPQCRRRASGGRGGRLGRRRLYCGLLASHWL
eukprot:2199812-Pyramimonas_sp.AAC.1